MLTARLTFLTFVSPSKQKLKGMDMDKIQEDSMLKSEAGGLPAVYTPEEVAKHIGWSPRKLRAFAREIGACRVLGNRMVLTRKDVEAILEASRPAPVPSRPAISSRIVHSKLPSVVAALITNSSFEEQLAHRKMKNAGAKSANGSQTRRNKAG